VGESDIRLRPPRLTHHGPSSSRRLDEGWQHGRIVAGGTGPSRTRWAADVFGFGWSLKAGRRVRSTRTWVRVVYDVRPGAWLAPGEGRWRTTRVEFDVDGGVAAGDAGRPYQWRIAGAGRGSKAIRRGDATDLWCAARPRRGLTQVGRSDSKVAIGTSAAAGPDRESAGIQTAPPGPEPQVAELRAHFA